MKLNGLLFWASTCITLVGCQTKSEIDPGGAKTAPSPAPPQPAVRPPVPRPERSPAPAKTPRPETAAQTAVPAPVELPPAVPWDSLTKISLEKEEFFDPRAYVFLPDGRTVAGGHDQIALWDAATGEKKQILPRPRGVPRSGPHSVMVWLACSADGKTLVTARQNPIGSTTDPNPLITVWSLPEGREQHSFELTGPLFNLDYAPALSPDGKLLVHVRKERNEKGHGIFGELSVWNLDSQEVQWALPDSGVKAVAISPDGSLLAGYDRKTIRLWNLQTGEVVRAIRPDGPRIEKLAFAQDGGMLAAASWGFLQPKKWLAFWDVQSGERTGAIAIPGSDHFLALNISSDGDRLGVVGAREVQIWNIKAKALLGRLELDRSMRIDNPAFSPDLMRLACTLEDPVVIDLTPLSN